jgi:hypothetical protein
VLCAAVRQVGYMGVPYNGSPMAQHPQYLTVRNSRGREMLDVLGAELTRTPAIDTGDRRPLVMQVRQPSSYCQYL